LTPFGLLDPLRAAYHEPYADWGAVDLRWYIKDLTFLAYVRAETEFSKAPKGTRSLNPSAYVHGCVNIVGCCDSKRAVVKGIAVVSVDPNAKDEDTNAHVKIGPTEGEAEKKFLRLGGTQAPKTLDSEIVNFEVDLTPDDGGQFWFDIFTGATDTGGIKARRIGEAAVKVEVSCKR